MRVIVNGNTYENVEWKDNGIVFATDMSLQQIDSAFAPGATANIQVFEGSEEVSRYYNKGIDSIMVFENENDQRMADVQFKLTRISDDAEAEINERIDDSDGAIMELAELVSEISDALETVEAFNERAHEIEVSIQSINRSIQSILERLDKLEPHNTTNEE